MIALFDTPWYAWPTTAALIASVVAIFIMAKTYLGQRHLKLIEAISNLGRDFTDFECGISLAALPSPNFGKRLERIGGWDGFADILNRMEMSATIVGFYGNCESAKAAAELYPLAKKLYLQVYNAVTYATAEVGSDDNLHQKRHDAMLFLTTVMDGVAQVDCRQKWLEIQSTTKLCILH